MAAPTPKPIKSNIVEPEKLPIKEAIKRQAV